MLLYWELVKFEFIQMFSYRSERIAAFVQYLLWIGFLILFWSVVLKGNNTHGNIYDLAAYFLIARGVSDLIMAEKRTLGRYVRTAIKDGTISSLMLRPMRLIPAIYAISLGRIGSNAPFTLLGLIIGIALHPPVSLEQLLVSLFFFLTAGVISFSFNLFEGVLAFHFTEVGGLKNTLAHITRIFSGAMIPLSFFPPTLKSIAEVTPFPAMIFAPTNALLNQLSLETMLKSGIVSLFWSIVLFFGVLFLWKKAIKKYEAVGL